MYTTRHRHSLAHRRAWAAVALLSLMVVAACGSNNKTDVPKPKSGDVSSEAKALVEKQLAAPTSVGVDSPLSKKPPTGLTFVEIGQADVLSAVLTQAEGEAAKALGWKFQHITPGNGAEDVQKAMQSALQLKPLPFAISVRNYGKESYLPQLAEAKSKGVLVISNSTLDEGGTGDGIVATVNQAKNSLVEPQQIAAWIAVNSKGSGNVLALDLPDYPIVHNAMGAFADALKSDCSGCTVTTVPVKTSDIGTNAPQNVVSEIQKNPKINYIFILGPVTTGLNAALGSAGVSDGKVKIVGMGPNPDNIQGLRDKDGYNYAWSAFSAPVSGWQTVDVAARLSVGDSIDNVMKQVSPTQILTPNNVGDAVQDGGGNYIGVADYKDLFKKMWQVN